MNPSLNQFKLSTFNAMSEKVAKAFTFRYAWQHAHRCIIPVAALFEPNWRSGKPVRTRFEAAGGEWLNVAGLWDQYVDDAGEQQLSYTMLTLDASAHALFKDYHRPVNDKRMVALLPASFIDAWLNAPPERARNYIASFPAEALLATAQPLPSKSTQATQAKPASAVDVDTSSQPELF